MPRHQTLRADAAAMQLETVETEAEQAAARFARIIHEADACLASLSRRSKAATQMLAGAA